jgi:TniQ
MNTAVITEMFKLAMPVVPPRSRLYHLEPVGVGTPQVESLTSYIIRLAEARCVSVATLYKYELDPVVRSLQTGEPRLEKSNRSRNSLIYESKSLNGSCDNSKAWVQALESSTLRRDLHLLTT